MLQAPNFEFNEIFVGGTLPEKFTEILSIIRERTIKLSETNIKKPDFNFWKKSGLLDKLLLKNNDHKWNKFSIMDVVVLKIINILWHRNTPDEKLISVIQLLLSSGIRLSEFVNPLTNTAGVLSYWENVDSNISATSSDSLSLNKSVIQLGQDIDLMMYLIEQKKLNPQLPNLSWVECFILGSLKTDRPFSLILCDDGEISYFFTDIISDNSNQYRTLLKKSFTNISINAIVADTLSPLSSTTAKSLNPLTNQSDIAKRIIEKGYDPNIVNEIFERNIGLTFEEESLSLDTKIERAINEHANQDILIKIRNSKKTSIRRVLITKK